MLASRIDLLSQMLDAKSEIKALFPGTDQREFWERAEDRCGGQRPAIRPGEGTHRAPPVRFEPATPPTAPRQHSTTRVTSAVVTAMHSSPPGPARAGTPTYRAGPALY